MEEETALTQSVVITSDSTCDLSQELLDRYDIPVIPLTITLGEDTFLDGSNFTPLDMYARYKQDGTLPKTSAPSVQEFLDFFSQFTEKGCEVVHLDISSELSNTYNAACMAAEELGHVHVVDSRMLSTGVGLLAIEGAECRDRGMGAQEIAEHLRGLTGKVQTSFVLDTLQFMWKGGRCSAVSALGANLLSLKPGLEMKDGKLGVYKKYRGNIKNVYKQYVKERLQGRKVRPGHVFITESGEVDNAVLEEICALVRETIPVQEIHHTMAGCTVSTHCGPKTLGILFIEE
ncbi:MAG: DegV family protein [Oscillospiraceae bacterium]|nr:DegV family protein [Oscillospiraceae bacterium]